MRVPEPPPGTGESVEAMRHHGNTNREIREIREKRGETDREERKPGEWSVPPVFQCFRFFRVFRVFRGLRIASYGVSVNSESEVAVMARSNRL